jgi:hypothetical protein
MAIRLDIDVPERSKDTICHIPSVHCHVLALAPAHWLDEIVVSQEGRPA